MKTTNHPKTLEEALEMFDDLSDYHEVNGEDEFKELLTTIWHAGRESVVGEIAHEQKKLLDGFSHDPKCEMCKLSDNKK